MYKYTFNFQSITTQVENLMSQKSRRLALYTPEGTAIAASSQDLLSLSGQTLQARVLDEAPAKTSSTKVGATCMFVNVHVGENGQKGTLFLENPRGDVIQSAQDLEMQVSI